MKSLQRTLGLVALAIALFTTQSRVAASESFHAVAEAETVETCELASANLITWSPDEIECPVCQTKNIFMVWGSYGNYIYQFPSKYQLVFWPMTDSQSWYSCKKCHYTAFMGQFREVPKEKIADLRKMLEGVSLPAPKERSREESLAQPPYLEIPTSQRLLVVEKVNRFLGETGDDYWNHFYRVLGYHFDREKKQGEADEARRKALAITERLLADKANDGKRKELLYLAGAMHHFLRDDTMALKNFEEAHKLKYSDKDLKPEQNTNYDNYISVLIDEYIEMLHKGKGPREQKFGEEH
jgi:hypothetical protein